MSIKTREDFVNYCLRRLGSPVIKINVDAEQVSDRVDEAIRYYIQYHYDGTEREVIKATITPDQAAKKAITLPDNIVSVLRCVPSRAEYENALSGVPQGATAPAGGSTTAISSSQQYMLTYPFYQPMPMLPGGGGDPYSSDGTYSMKSYVSYQVTNDVLRYLFRPEREVTFRHANNTVTFDVTTPMNEGDAFLFEVYTGIDPETHKWMWEDIWLQEFATCLIKMQWGQNLSKYSGVQLPTGITLDGQKILDDANNEREKLLQRLNDQFSYPPDFFMG